MGYLIMSPKVSIDGETPKFLQICEGPAGEIYTDDDRVQVTKEIVDGGARFTFRAGAHSTVRIFGMKQPIDWADPGDGSDIVNSPGYRPTFCD